MSTIFEIFPGIAIYDTEPVEVENPFSGETATLTPEEVAVYRSEEHTSELQSR
jgi:hypothetical protein